MTDKEAKILIKNWLNKRGDILDFLVALNRVVDALDHQVNEGDCISRSAVLGELEDDQYHLEYCKEHGIDRSVSMEMVRIRLNDLPSVRVATRIGRWIFTQYSDPKVGNWHCSECLYCNFSAITPKWNYCPNCGAKMEVEN